MCTFSESSRVRLGNAVMYIAARAKYPYKTEVLKLLFLMEERMVQKYHVPMLSIPYSVWRLGPVSVDVFEELSDGPVLLSDFVTLQFNGQGIMVKPSREFDEDEFSDAELEVMAEVMEKYGDMNSEQLIDLTAKAPSGARPPRNTACLRTLSRSGPIHPQLLSIWPDSLALPTASIMRSRESFMSLPTRHGWSMPDVRRRDWARKKPLQR